MNKRLHTELIAMAAEDQRIRNLALKVSPLGQLLPPELADEWARIDGANTRRLQQIVAEHGWPGRSLVGDDGTEAAWLLAQHADRNPHLQREFLDRLTVAVSAGEAEPRHLAYLTDRVAVHDGRPQTYGTQIADIVDGRAVPQPIHDEAEVDRRRGEVGLNPLAEHLAEIVARYGGAASST